NGLPPQLGDVLRLHLLGATRLSDAVLDHRQAERAAGRDGALAAERAGRLVDAILVDALAERFLQPHPAAARATTERLRPAALHLPHPDADRHQGLPRSLADSIVPREVTAVVVGDRHVEHRPAGAGPANGDQLRDPLRMEPDPEVPPE